MQENQGMGRIPNGQPQKPYIPKKPFFKKWWFWVIVVVIVFGIFGGAFGGNKGTGSSSTDTGTSAAVSTDADASAKEEEQVIALGTSVDTEKFQITVNGMHTTNEIIYGNGYLSSKPDPGNEFIIINVKIKNIDKNMESINNTDFQLFTLDKDVQYSPSSLLATGSDEKYIWMDSLNPDSSITGNIVYEVVQGLDLSKLQLRYHDTWSILGDYKYFSIQ